MKRRPKTLHASPNRIINEKRIELALVFFLQNKHLVVEAVVLDVRLRNDVIDMI